MNSVLLDRLELSFLNGLQDQREVQQRVREGTRIGLGMANATANGQTRPAEPEDMGIVNRSPTIHNHYQSAPVVEPAPPQAKPVNPWPWIALIITVLALASAWAVWQLGHQPQPTKPVNPGQYGLGLDDLKVF